MQAVARLVSYILNPLTSAFATILIITFTQNIATGYKIAWLIIGFLGSLVPPLVLYLDYKRGKVKSFWSPLAYERQKSFMIWVIAAGIISLYFYIFAVDRLVLAVTIVFLVLGLVNLLLSTTFKLSIHSEMLTLFVLTAILAISVSYLYLTVLIPLLGWARIYVKAHTISEVSFGILLTILVVFTVFGLFGIATF